MTYSVTVQMLSSLAMERPPKTEPETPTDAPPRGRGRPKSQADQFKGNTLRVRLTAAQRRDFNEVAAFAGKEASTWLRELGEREVRRVRKANPAGAASPSTREASDAGAASEPRDAIDPAKEA